MLMYVCTYVGMNVFLLSPSSSLYTRVYCSCVLYILHYLLIRSRISRYSLYLLPRMSQLSGIYIGFCQQIEIKFDPLFNVFIYRDQNQMLRLSIMILCTKILRVECRFGDQKLSTQSLLTVTVSYRIRSLLNSLILLFGIDNHTMIHSDFLWGV